MEEKLLRRAAHLSTLFSSGLIFIYFETNKNKFHSSFDFVINIYKQHPVLVTLLTFGFLGICWFGAVAVKIGLWRALSLAKWRFLKCMRHSIRLWGPYKYYVAAILLGLAWKLDRTGFFDACLNMGQSALSYLGFYFDTATTKSSPDYSSISSNRIPNSLFSGLGSSQDYSYSSSLSSKKATLVGSITSDLVDKGNFGINKSLPTLPDHSSYSRVRCVDTNFLRIFTLDFKPNFCNTIPYRVHSQCSSVSSFGDIILVHGKEFVVRPVIL